MSNHSKAVYFPHLDALRALAFLLVFFEHSALISTNLLDNSTYFYKLKTEYLYRGYMGVGLFFVLSGFLISYLLFREYEIKGKVRIDLFYMRRLLRIWPLYYLVIFIGFVIVPYFRPELLRASDQIWKYLLFVANFNSAEIGHTLNNALLPMWSLSVEEQFYLIFPLLLFFFKPDSIPGFMVLFILISLLYRSNANADYIQMGEHSLSVMCDLAIGVLIGYMTYYKSNLMNHFSKIKKSLSLIFYFLGLYLLMNSEFDYSSSSKTYSRLIYSVFFAFVILEQSFSQNPVFRLSSIPGFNYLGKISFGLYCLHQPALLISTWFSTSVIHPQSWWIQYLCIIIPGMLLSVLFATFSYWLIEKPILSYKEKFNVFER